MINGQTGQYQITIDERRGCITSLSLEGKEYIGSRPEPLFQIQMYDENLMTSVVVDAFCGKLLKSEEKGATHILTYGDFQTCGLKVIVSITMQKDIIWDISIEENEWYYLEYIDFPKAAIPKDLLKNFGFSKVLWSFDEVEPQKIGCVRADMNGRRTVFDYSTIPSMKEVYKDYFKIASAVEPRDLVHYKDLVLSQFNELTTENRMKPGNIHPREDIFCWTGTDKIVEFAQEHHLSVRGHGLVYEKVLPPWIYKNEDGSRATKERVMQRLETHIKTIVSRYKGKIQSYDVVNELFGHEGWDTRELTRLCGIGFVPQVYKWAHEADPDAILILNDNYHDIPEKRQYIFEWVKKWLDEGAPIHGIGFQDHLYIDTSLDAVEETFKLFSSIPNFKIYITELDINAYAFEDFKNRYPDYMIDEVMELVAKKYAALFDIYRKYADHIETVGFWNVCNQRTWLDEYYVAGRKHYPLPFDYDGAPTEAFYRIIDLDKKLPRWDKNTMVPPIRNNNYVICHDTDTLVVQGKHIREEYETVDIKLFTDFGEKKLIKALSEMIGAEYRFEMSLTDGVEYDGTTSPDFVLEVMGNDGIVKTDRFTYYTKRQKQDYYTVTDKLYDFSKVLRQENCEIKENGVVPKWFWGNGSFGKAVLVYDIPDGFTINGFELHMTTVNDLCYQVLASRDDTNYELLDISWELAGEENGMQKYVGTARNPEKAIRYIKIDLSEGLPDYWCEYKAALTYVKLTTDKK